MGSMTLTGPPASFDRSTAQSISWTWAQTRVNEQLYRWRLKYRVVGSGTWLYARDPIETQLLPNGSAESSVGWRPQYGETAQNFFGGGRPGGGSGAVHHSLFDTYGMSGTVYVNSFSYPSNGSPYNTLVPVVPGAKYVASVWLKPENYNGYDTYAQIAWIGANGSSSVGGTAQPRTIGEQNVWHQIAVEGVAPAGAAYAWIYGGYYTPLANGQTTWADDFTLERVDNASTALATTDANGWTYKYVGVPQGGSATIPASFLAAGNYEAQLEYVTAGQSLTSVTYVSNTVTFTAVTAPTAPTITSPAANAVIPTITQNVVFSHATGQANVQVRVMDGATVKWDSGTVAISTAATSSTVSATFADNGTARQIQARTQLSGVWSSWASRDVTVSYTPPAVPTLTAVAEDTMSYGSLQSVRITVTNPTPTGSQPTVTSYLASWRYVGGGTERAIGSQTAGSQLVWYHPPSSSAGQLQVKVTALASSNGTSRDSAWTTVSGTVAVRGVVLADPEDPSTVSRSYRLNDDGAEDTHEVESALLTYSGREYPVVEYGPGTSRTIDVPKLSLRTDAELANLRELLTRRQVLVYRDKRGRAVKGRLTLGTVKDTSYGFETSLTVDVIDSWGA